MSSTLQWVEVTRLTSRPSAQVRVFAFPWSGGNAAVYRQWARTIPENVEILPITLPGREKRFKDAPATSVDEVVKGVYNEIKSLIGEKPYVLFGHSLGGIMAYELARHIRSQAGQPMPKRLILSASRWESGGTTLEKLAELPDDQFIEKLNARFPGAIPDMILKDEGMLKMYLGPLKNDLNIFESYPCQLDEADKLDLPYTLFGGERDADPHTLQNWATTTTGAVETKVFSGGHFYFTEGKDITQKLLEELTAAVVK
eukprot:GFYU01035176.1.p1 GENE.GFYU01035176.1~~GFYU01035176.1.p1  ORF type:complete len:266 (+),score=56.51 GFYU01035176.1:28-798(+)